MGITPGFTGINDGYTVRIDYNNNVYVMGGGINKGGTPSPSWDYQVKKFAPSGVLQWTAVTQSSNAGFYGDMVVLRSGKAIVGHGFGSSDKVYIIEPSQGLVTTKISTKLEPGWRFSYNQSANDSILWIGGGSNNGTHLYRADTNITSVIAFSPWINAANTEDVCYLAQDIKGEYIYVTNSANTPSGSQTDPRMCKVSRTAPGTAVWKVNELTNLQEVGQGSFINGGILHPIGTRGWATGVNGMIVINDRVYTYNGNVIRSYFTSNGLIADSLVTGGGFDKFSGMDADNCGRIYIGGNKEVRRYNASLGFDLSVPVADSVYDLKLNPRANDTLYITGKKFLQKLVIDSCTVIPTLVTEKNRPADINLFPNPAKNEITLRLTGIENGTYDITVRDVTGKVIIKTQIEKKGNSDKILPTESLRRGIYTITISNSERSFIKKFVLE